MSSLSDNPDELEGQHPPSSVRLLVDIYTILNETELYKDDYPNVEDRVYDHCESIAKKLHVLGLGGPPDESKPRIKKIMDKLRYSLIELWALHLDHLPQGLRRLYLSDILNPSGTLFRKRQGDELSVTIPVEVEFCTAVDISYQFQAGTMITFDTQRTNRQIVSFYSPEGELVSMPAECFPDIGILVQDS